MISCLLLLVQALTLDAVQQFPPLVEVEVGSSVTLLCSTNGMPATFCYTIIWTMVAPRTKKLVSFKNTADFKKTVQTECSFELKNVTVEDSGTYYCLVVYGKMVYVGNGSEVIVTKERKTSPPPIEILRPSSKIDGSFTPLWCMIPGVLPQVRMFWFIDGQEKMGFTETVWAKAGGETVEFTQNRVLVPAEQWERGTAYTCVVEFEGRMMSKSVQKENGDDWGGCYALVVSYRTVLTTLCLLSWTMTITVAICFSRKKKQLMQEIQH